MAKNVIRISEAEAASDFAALMVRVRAGAEVVIHGPWRSFMLPRRCAVASPSASRWPKRTKKKPAKLRFGTQGMANNASSILWGYGGWQREIVAVRGPLADVRDWSPIAASMPLLFL
jgi:hypothetical protein